MLPDAKPGGRPRAISLRQVLNAILYVTRGGTWHRIHETLRACVRRKVGRHKHPTAACLDSHSVKTTALAGAKGYDAGKHIQGRKRHLLVDTLDLILVIVVTAASVQDRDGAKLVFQALPGSCKKLRRIWVMGDIAESY